MRACWIFSCLLLIALAPRAFATENKVKNMDITLDWSMKIEGGKLRIDYTVENRGKARIYLLDELVSARKLNPEAVIVQNGDAPGVVAFVRALVTTKEKVLAIQLPAARPVEPGQKATGKGLVPLPLSAWHNYSRVDALKGELTRATLSVGYLLEPGPIGFAEETLADGAHIRVPKPEAMQKHAMLRGTEKPLPAGAHNR